MIEVELPDGSIAEFPDGTAPDVITDALKRQFQESQQSQDLRSDLSAMTQNPDTAAFNRQQYENLPGWQKPIVAASDVGQLTAKGAMNMFGISPEKVAATVRAPFTGRSYEDELRDQKAFTQRARDRAGSAATGAEVVGGATAGLGAARNGLTLLRGGVATAPGIGGVAARTGLMGIEGAGYGAANAFANDRDIAEGAMYGAAGGAGGNLISEAATSLLSKAAGAFNKKPVTPTKDELVALKDAAYDAADNAGVMFTPKAVDRIRSKVINDLTELGFDTALHPGATAALKRVQGLSGQNVTLKGLDAVRKVASNGYMPATERGAKANNLAVSKIIQAIDDVIAKPGSNDILMGDKAGMKALQEARKYASRVSKLETVENLVKRGNIQADRNITDTAVKSVKTQLSKINDPFGGWGRGFTKAEREAAAKAASYTPAQRALHGASVMNPFGGGKLTAAGHTGLAAYNLATGNLLGLGAQAIGAGVGAGFGKAGEHLANKSVRELTELIARGGILAPTTKNAVQKLAESKRDAIARGLLSYAILNSRREEAPAK